MADLRDPAGPRGGDDDEIPEPAPVRRLRLLVTTLMVVLIAGMITVTAALVIRLGIGGGTEMPATLAPVSADSLTLPAGAEIRALGRGPGEVLVLTRDADGAERLRILDAASGAVRSVTPVRRE
jgi:molybdopterin-binding protein